MANIPYSILPSLGHTAIQPTASWPLFLFMPSLPPEGPSSFSVQLKHFLLPESYQPEQSLLLTVECGLCSSSRQSLLIMGLFALMGNCLSLSLSYDNALFLYRVLFSIMIA